MEILEGLDFIHKNNIIHSDMKFANILLNRPSAEEKAQGVRPEVKLCDFGISQIIPPLNTVRKSVMVERSGTYGYIAPEVNSNEKLIGPEVDMWAFGVILYEMCTAYKPTAIKKYQYGSGPIPYVPRDWRKLDKKGAPI